MFKEEEMINNNDYLNQCFAGIDVDDEDLILEGFRPEFLRILPTALPILDEEVKWLLPFSVDNVMWDHSSFDLYTSVEQLIVKGKLNAYTQNEQKNLEDLVKLNPYI